MNSARIFHFADNNDVQYMAGDLFSSYLELQESKFKARLPEDMAKSETNAFKSSLSQLIDQYANIFKSSEGGRTAYLVLGRVQSGKTAHLLGNIAWAASNNNVSLAVIFTGTALALNNQGVERIENDLQNIPGGNIDVIEVPTSASNPKFEETYARLRQLVVDRIGSTTKNSKLPLLVTIKRPGRIRAVLEMKKRLVAEFGDQVASMIIDDETDQASQNALANKSRIAATYGALANLYQTGRSVMLSYTATPQAVFLTEKYGKLRPDYCVVIEPRQGYFGLSDLISAQYASNRHVVEDLLPKITSHKNPPASMVQAIALFLITGIIRTKFPSEFYSERLVEDSLTGRSGSVQMLIHQSTLKGDHAHIKELVKKSLKHLAEVLASSSWNSDGEFAEAWTLLSNSSKVVASIDAKIPETIKETLIESMSSLAIRVVNSDIKKTDPEQQIPVKDNEWEEATHWILIGGEILGRGLTIPQLTVSYFVRSSASPKFDTVAQQMRFCGYRQDYRSLTHIFSTESNIELFRYMEGIDKVLWRKARRWSASRTRISGNNQPIYYASPIGTPLDPCRKSVQDPDLQDLRFDKGSEVIVSLRDIFNPLQVKDNIELVHDLLGRSISNKDKTAYLKIEHVDEALLIRLLQSWEGPRSVREHLRAIASLYDDALGEWGLANIPVAFFVKVPSLADYYSPSVFSDLDAISRGINPGDLDLQGWKEVRDSGQLDQPVKWPTLRVGHVGDGQRALRKNLGYDATVVIVEPIRGVVTHTDKAVSWGLGLTVFRPEGFELRVIGHK